MSERLTIYLIRNMVNVYKYNDEVQYNIFSRLIKVVCNLILIMFERTNLRIRKTLIMITQETTLILRSSCVNNQTN
jgi:hypothetical protein